MSIKVKLKFWFVSITAVSYCQCAWFFKHVALPLGSTFIHLPLLQSTSLIELMNAELNQTVSHRLETFTSKRGRFFREKETDNNNNIKFGATINSQIEYYSIYFRFETPFRYEERAQKHQSFHTFSNVVVKITQRNGWVHRFWWVQSPDHRTANNSRSCSISDTIITHALVNFSIPKCCRRHDAVNAKMYLKLLTAQRFE